MNALETLYDRLRGKEPVNRLAPMLAPDPGMVDSGPDTAYTPRQNPLNVLGSKLLGIAEDPRNAWIGAGPIAMAAKIPKAAKEAYHVIDSHTGDIIGAYESLKRAANKADKLDNEYGAVRYVTKPVSATGKVPNKSNKQLNQEVRPPEVTGLTREAADMDPSEAVRELRRVANHTPEGRAHDRLLKQYYAGPNKTVEESAKLESDMLAARKIWYNTPEYKQWNRTKAKFYRNQPAFEERMAPVRPAPNEGKSGTNSLAGERGITQKQLRQDAIDSLRDDEIELTEKNVVKRMQDMEDQVREMMGD